MKLCALLFSLLLGFSQADLIPGWNLSRTMELKGATHHVQGIDFDAHTLWVTSVDRERRKGFLQKFSMDSGALLQTMEVQEDERYHPGGVAADGNSLWLPVAEYRAHSSSVIQRRDRNTLKLMFQFPVSDHIGCVAVTPEYLIGGNWDSETFYLWDHTGKLIRTIPSGTRNAYQDLKFEPPYLVASGRLADGTGAIDWLSLPSFALSQRTTAGKTDREASLTREGMAIRKDQLLLLPEDEPSRLFVFRRALSR
jgi:hypothetical protein